MNADTGHHTAIPADAVIFAMGAWSSDLTGTNNDSIPVISGIGKLGDDWSNPETAHHWEAGDLYLTFSCQ
jgi:glycine/D-amino acid oxidase-like deaminating enzyme